MRLYQIVALLYWFFTLRRSALLTLSYFISLVLRSLLLFCFSAYSRLPRAHICLLRAIGMFVSSSLLLLHHWFLYFFRFSYLFLFYHCSKVIIVSFPRWCLGFHCALFSPSLLSPLLPLSHHSSPPPLPSHTRLMVFNFFLMLLICLFVYFL